MAYPKASAELASSVNSVCTTWTIELEEGKSAGETRLVKVIAALDPKAKDVSKDGGVVGITGTDEEFAVEASAGADGVLKARGSSEFHFLLPAQDYVFTLRLADNGRGYGNGSLLTQQARTSSCGEGLNPSLARRLPREMWCTYVGNEHRLGQWLGSSPEDMMWALQPEYELLRALWLNACFTLPSPESPITQCPNPVSRYCLDLTKNQPWLRSKKVRRFKKDFRLTVNSSYRETFMQCECTHTDDGKGTWITPQLVDCLDRCRREGGELRVYSIELWEKSSGKLAAAIMALSVGDIFHDYTMATMIRDSRSAGSILTKVVGHLLTEAGFTLWYWGFKNPYMAEYDGQYGGTTLDNRSEFWPRWQQALEMARSGSSCDLTARVPSGTGLDLETLSAVGVGADDT
eukprot:TRINITY_DN32802_c0_g1_i1.p1 TRINITY_DN32802_c0_g1~~TRINITY_DN32802_c0_g1_i1.p1  ORF type:complete len:412 (-),score=61.28 TRINITY_DN32802_c0_g1_i1:58-1269(-)